MAGVGRYAVRVKRSAKKEMTRLPRGVYVRVSRAIEGLCDDPRSRGCKKLSGHGDLWRVRVGGYRVMYTVDDVIEVVEVREVAKRGDAYKK